ncbi:hypothetical protein [Anthocerotibacter panamensis]|uniref:hypothetical protein n=1 Tax=Anthocerotibacter panamensis TaxID=2857077 RepID=UPI001C406749|nr:hypothetical protein [Anthocerotibacter panamensis]
MAYKIKSLLVVALVLGLSQQVSTAANTPHLQLTPADPRVTPNRLVFSTVNREVRPPALLRITNTGSSLLTLTALYLSNSLQANMLPGRRSDAQRAADFILVNPPRLPLNLTAGESVALAVQFRPQRRARLSNGPTHTTDGECYAALNILSNDPEQPTLTVHLAGLNSANYQGKNEVSVAEITRAFGWSIKIGTERHILGGDKTWLGEEVYSPYWVQANPEQPVYLWPLAVYLGPRTIPFGTTKFQAKAGSDSRTLYRFAGTDNDDNTLGSNDRSGGENQKLLPKIYVDGSNRLPQPADVAYTPTGPFQLVSEEVYSGEISAGDERLHSWRFYPVRDDQGSLIPDHWYAIEDAGLAADLTTEAKNYDYNDTVYLLVNARPEDSTRDPNLPGPVPGSAMLDLDFGRSYPGTLTDRHGEPLGFTSTQRNRKDTFATLNSYDPNQLDLNPATGLLTVTSRSGENNRGPNNALVNGLQMAFDGQSGPFIVSATLLGPLNNFKQAPQQAGLFFGPDPDNFVQLAVQAQSNGSLSLEFYQERQARSTRMGSVAIPNPADVQMLDLMLFGDPQTGTLQAAYRRTDGDTGIVVLPARISLSATEQGRFFAPQSKAGLMVHSKDELPFTATFKHFRIAP